ncbi:MAG: hypothetical protein IPP12_22530 [Nitrospira sp.]|nr:hypothetical protein [Nitrospira sp.]
MSNRRLRKRRHIREARHAETRVAVKQVAELLRREIDEKLMALSRMSAPLLTATRPLGLLRGSVQVEQSPKLEPGEFLSMAGLGDDESLWPPDTEQLSRMIRSSSRVRL